jgi:hypothetical protein
MKRVKTCHRHKNTERAHHYMSNVLTIYFQKFHTPGPFCKIMTETSEQANQRYFKKKFYNNFQAFV